MKYDGKNARCSDPPARDSQRRNRDEVVEVVLVRSEQVREESRHFEKLLVAPNIPVRPITLLYAYVLYAIDGNMWVVVPTRNTAILLQIIAALNRYLFFALFAASVLQGNRGSSPQAASATSTEDTPHNENPIPANRREGAD